jgi:hypothetical protein
MTDYLSELFAALGIADRRRRDEITSEFARIARAADGEDVEIPGNSLKEAIAPHGRFETASGRSDEPGKALETAISAMLLREGLFFKSYAVVVAVRSQEMISQAQASEMSRKMKKLVGRFSNILVLPVKIPGVQGYEVRLFSIVLEEAGGAR